MNYIITILIIIIESKIIYVAIVTSDHLQQSFVILTFQTYLIFYNSFTYLFIYLFNMQQLSLTVYISNNGVRVNNNMCKVRSSNDKNSVKIKISNNNVRSKTIVITEVMK